MLNIRVLDNMSVVFGFEIVPPAKSDKQKALAYAALHMPKDGKDGTIECLKSELAAQKAGEDVLQDRIEKLEAKSKTAPDKGDIERINKDLAGMEKMFGSTAKAIETLEINAKQARENLAKSIKMNTKNIVRTMEIMETENKLKL